MARPAVFLDTVALLALANRDDALHEQAKSIHESLASEQVPLLTSDWVLAEFLGAASRRPLREAACLMIQRLQRSQRVELVPATRQAWERAFEFYSQRPDKAWSFVDCTSILICEDRRVRQVFTQDRHFVQAGLDVMLH